LVGVSNVLEVRVGAPGQGGEGGGEGGGDGGGDGGDAGLPITGPATAPLAGSALVLILLGVGLVRLGRRRPAGTR
jgi:hypothetical protein